MERVNLIIEHPLFVEQLKKVKEFEKNRIFCGHDMTHFLDVARIGYILALEERYAMPFGYDLKEIFYAAAMLHDIGRAGQYEDGTAHEVESTRLSETILPDCGFSSGESELILDAILSHRTKSENKRDGISEYLYRADKLSRNCIDCLGIEQCDWKLKNYSLKY